MDKNELDKLYYKTLNKQIMENVRQTLVLRNGLWENTNMIDLRKNDVFRVIEPNGTPVFVDDFSEFTASDDAYYNEDNIVAIKIDTTDT